MPPYRHSPGSNPETAPRTLALSGPLAATPPQGLTLRWQRRTTTRMQTPTASPQPPGTPRSCPRPSDPPRTPPFASLEARAAPPPPTVSRSRQAVNARRRRLHLHLHGRQVHLRRRCSQHPACGRPPRDRCGHLLCARLLLSPADVVTADDDTCPADVTAPTDIRRARATLFFSTSAKGSLNLLVLQGIRT
jgi:hypothetical protein